MQGHIHLLLIPPPWLLFFGRYNFPSPWWDNVSKEAKDLVQRLLVLDPQKRLTAAQVLKHTWITGGAADTDLGGVKDLLHKYNATRKFKKAAHGIMAGGRLAKMAQESRARSVQDQSATELIAVNMGCYENEKRNVAAGDNRFSRLRFLFTSLSILARS